MAYFYYDNDDSPVSMKYNGTMYYYVKTIQGDIVKVLAEDGTEVYYCIYSNKADSKRQYLFIGYIGADLYTWSCEEDVCINSKTSDTSHEKNIYYKQVKECDKY